MANKKIVTIDKEKYIKKIHYDNLEKRKIKVIKEKCNISDSDFLISNPENVLAIFSLYNCGDDYKNSKIQRIRNFTEVDKLDVRMVGSTEYSGEPIIRVSVCHNIYNYKYLEQAKNIINAFGMGIDFTYNIDRDDKKSCLLLNFSFM